MDINLPKPGNYVVAVSGGVDSMVLLHLLADAQCQAPDGWQLTVAHLDHGIRADSSEDRKLVQNTAKTLDLPFEYQEITLGTGASEALARQKRYEFLHEIQRITHAAALLTAHHQDDVIETALINMARGTGRKGLTALHNNQNTLRPLINVPKATIIDYAKQQVIAWREDSTNQDSTYLRNHIRQTLMPKLSDEQRQQFLGVIDLLSTTNQQLDTMLVNQLHQQQTAHELDRHWFNALPHVVAREVMATWLREHSVRDFSANTLERLVTAAKVSKAGKQLDVLQGVSIAVTKDSLALVTFER